MKLREPYKFSEILEFVIKKLDGETSYCIYSNIYDSKHLNLDTICYLDDYPEITEADEEIFSEFVVNNSLEFLFRDELVQDVVLSVLEQKSTATENEILRAIQYYDENDDFMDFD